MAYFGCPMCPLDVLSLLSVLKRLNVFYNNYASTL
jgi:hypothetical protein